MFEETWRRRRMFLVAYGTIPCTVQYQYYGVLLLYGDVACRTKIRDRYWTGLEAIGTVVYKYFTATAISPFRDRRTHTLCNNIGGDGTIRVNFANQSCGVVKYLRAATVWERTNMRKITITRGVVYCAAGDAITRHCASPAAIQRL